MSEPFATQKVKECVLAFRDMADTLLSKLNSIHNEADEAAAANSVRESLLCMSQDLFDAQVLADQMDEEY